MLHKNLSVNSAGHLALAGMDTVELAKKYGTPLYLMDENRIRENCQVYIDAMRKYMGEGSRPIFASKACCFKRMYAIISELGMGTDIVSPGELYTANAAGFPMENAYFHGNNKTDADIEYAMSVGIGCFIVDNREEVDTVNACAARRGIRQKILLRLTPGIDPHTQKKISTGKVDSKFGTAIETGQALELCKYALGLPAVQLEGFHCHIGSQIFDYYPFRDAAEIMLRFIRTLLDECDYEIRVLNLGGGFGVRYVESDPVVDYEANIRGLAGEIQRICGELSIRQPDILMEPGRRGNAVHGRQCENHYRIQKLCFYRRRYDRQYPICHVRIGLHGIAGKQAGGTGGLLRYHCRTLLRKRGSYPGRRNAAPPCARRYAGCAGNWRVQLFDGLQL